MGNEDIDVVDVDVAVADAVADNSKPKPPQVLTNRIPIADLLCDFSDGYIAGGMAVAVVMAVVMAAVTTGRVNSKNEIARRVDRNMVMTRASDRYQPPLDDRSAAGRYSAIGDRNGRLNGTSSPLQESRFYPSDRDCPTSIMTK